MASYKVLVTLMLSFSLVAAVPLPSYQVEVRGESSIMPPSVEVNSPCSHAIDSFEEPNEVYLFKRGKPSYSSNKRKDKASQAIDTSKSSSSSIYANTNQEMILGDAVKDTASSSAARANRIISVPISMRASSQYGQIVSSGEKLEEKYHQHLGVKKANDGKGPRQLLRLGNIIRNRAEEMLPSPPLPRPDRPYLKKSDLAEGLRGRRYSPINITPEFAEIVRQGALRRQNEMKEKDIKEQLSRRGKELQNPSTSSTPSHHDPLHKILQRFETLNLGHIRRSGSIRAGKAKVDGVQTSTLDRSAKDSHMMEDGSGSQ